MPKQGQTRLITAEELIVALKGKGIERGLPMPLHDGDMLIYPWDGDMDDPDYARRIDLHEQSFRSLVKRIAPDWRVRIVRSEPGWTVEVYPKPNSAAARALKSNDDRVIDLTKQVEELAAEVARLRADG